MASEQVSSPVPAPTKPWFARLGLSGKLLAIGGLAGIIISFLPLASVSVEMGGKASGGPFGMLGDGNPFGMGGGKTKVEVQLPGLNVSKTVMVVENWRGIICLVAYVAALFLAFVLYPPKGLAQGLKALPWAGVGAGLLAAVMAIWLLVLAMDSVDMMGMSVKATPAIGAFLNVLAAATIASGGFLKAREEKLI